MDDTRSKIIQGRQKILALLETLHENDFEKISVLSPWRIKELVTHILLEVHYTPAASAIGTVWHGGINRYMRWAAQDYSAKRTTNQLIDELRVNTDNFQSPPGITLREVYIDLVLHRQDILLSLGRKPDLSNREAEDIFTYLPNLSLTARIVLRDALRRLQNYMFVFSSDGTSFGQGKLALHTTKSEAILIILGRIAPKR